MDYYDMFKANCDVKSSALIGQNNVTNELHIVRHTVINPIIVALGIAAVLLIGSVDRFPKAGWAAVIILLSVVTIVLWRSRILVKRISSLQVTIDEIEETNRELVTQNRVLLKRNSRLERENSEHKQQLHVLCHDLANPLSSILTILGIVSTPDELDETLLSLLNTSAQNGHKLIMKIRKLIDVDEAIDCDAVQEQSLYTLVQESTKILSHRFEQKKVQFETDVSRDIKVNVDPVIFVNSVLNNIFTNAVKFSYTGSKVTCEASMRQGGVELKIRDVGIGMPASLVNGMFGVDQNKSRNGTEGEPGTGYGMPLVKKYVEAFGCKMTISSKEKSSNSSESGTTIVINFPPYEAG